MDGLHSVFLLFARYDAGSTYSSGDVGMFCYGVCLLNELGYAKMAMEGK